MIPNNALQLVRVERDNDPLEIVHGHVRSVVRLRARRLGLRDHRSPRRDVLFVDILHVVFELELRGRGIISVQNKAR